MKETVVVKLYCFEMGMVIVIKIEPADKNIAAIPSLLPLLYKDWEILLFLGDRTAKSIFNLPAILHKSYHHQL